MNGAEWDYKFSFVNNEKYMKYLLTIKAEHGNIYTDRKNYFKKKRRITNEKSSYQLYGKTA